MAPRAGAKPRIITPQHNFGVLTDEERDALQITHMAQARKDNLALEAAMQAVKDVRKIRTRNRNLVSTDGFPLKLFDEILTDETRDDGDLAAEADLRARMRSVAALPAGTQLKLFDDSFSKHDQDMASAMGRGLTAGLRGDDGVPPEELHPEFHQNWLEGWVEGQTKLLSAMTIRAAIDARRNAASAPEPGEDDSSDRDEDEDGDLDGAEAETTH